MVAFVWPRVAGSAVLPAGSTGPQPGAPIPASFLLRRCSPSRMLSKAPVLGVVGFLPHVLITLQLVGGIKAVGVINNPGPHLLSAVARPGFQRGC